MEEAIDDFLPPPRGKSRPQDFDLLAHLEVKELAAEGEEAEESAAGGDEEDDADELLVIKYRKVTPNIQEHWIKLIPDRESFIDVIKKTFREGLQAIKCFERWSKHSDLVVYSKALETWDDRVGDDWGEGSLESTSLDPQQWIQQSPVNNNSDSNVTKHVNSAYSKAQRFLTRFQPLLEIYWRNKQFNPEILVDVNLMNSVESLQNTLILLKHYTHHFQTQLPGTTDIGLLHLDS